MSRVVVVGAGGMLGHKVCQLLKGHKVVGLVRGAVVQYQVFPLVFDNVSLRGEVDVLSGDRLRTVLQEEQPQFVINCVGVVKQLEEANDPCLTVAINSLLPHQLARWCGEIGARLVHISTDCVFDGSRGSYLESDVSDARDFYGRSKALGETLPAETAALTLRTSFIGRELKSRTHGLVEWFLAQSGKGVDGYANVIYSGVTSIELAKVILRLVDDRMNLSGVFQVASEPISKYDLLTLIRQAYGLEIEVRRSQTPVSDRSLVMGAFSDATGYKAPSWAQMISAMHDDPTPYEKWKGGG
ncbi:MAG: SDR family oxidoreductase [Acidobacteriota bacterium]|nr:SDR family oxidoreductase [Acidobacteriota bacterium]